VLPNKTVPSIRQLLHCNHDHIVHEDNRTASFVPANPASPVSGETAISRAASS
jgi:hypothetical protein